jgi:hypothetical protein
LVKKRELKELKYLINKYKQLDFSNNDKYLIIDLNNYYYHYIKKDYDSCFFILNKIDNYSTKLSQFNLNQHFTHKAYIFNKVNQLDSATNYFVKSLIYFEKDTSSNYLERANIYQGLAAIYRLTDNTDKQLKYLKLYLEEAKTSGNEYKISSSYNSLGVFYDKKNEPLKALQNFKKSLNYKQRDKSRNTTLQNIGSIYLNHFNNIDSAYYYNNKAINKHTSYRNLAFIHYDLSLIANRKNNLVLENKELQISLKNIKLDPFQELEVKLYKDLSKNNK